MKVSILIPAYNNVKYLKQTIQSALDQTCDSKEIIVVDDGSTDGSLEVARSFEAHGVRVFSQSNGGACKARNRAFAESTGEFIQYLDGDDLISPDKISSQLAAYTEAMPATVFTCSWVRFYDSSELATIKPQRSFLDRDWDHPIDWLVQSWCGKGMGQTSIWLTPRHIIEKTGGWDERLSVNQDGEFFCRVLLLAERIRFSESGFVCYRSGMAGSVSQRKSAQRSKDVLFSFRLCHEAILGVSDSPATRNAIGFNYARFIYEMYDESPALAAQARGLLQELNLPSNPAVGGRFFKLLSGVTGFWTALKLRSSVRKLLR